MAGPVDSECMEVVFFLMDHIDAALLQLDKHDRNRIVCDARSQSTCGVRPEEAIGNV